MVVERKMPESESFLSQLRGTISRSWEMTKLSYSFLKDHKELVFFPIVSSIVMLILIASFVIPFLEPDWFQVFENERNSNKEIMIGILLFLYYFLSYFIIIFFNAGLVSSTLIIITGEKASFSTGISLAVTRLPQIIGWAFISAIFGLLLRVIEKMGNRFGETVSAFLGTTWSLIAYFVLPTVVVEGVGPINAMKKSFQIFKSTWGEIIGGNISFALIGFLLMIPILFIAWISKELMPDNLTDFYHTIFFAVITVPSLLVILLTSTLSTIYSTLLYACATGHDMDSDIDVKKLQNSLGSFEQGNEPRPWP